MGMRRSSFRAAAVILTIGTALAVLSPPDLVIREPGAIDPADYLFIVKIPFRDRAPEQAGDTILKQLASCTCVRALSFLDPSRRETVCDREREYPLLRWSVAERVDSGNRSRVHFLTTRRTRKGSVDQVNVWITVEQRSTKWQPVDFECWY